MNEQPLRMGRSIRGEHGRFVAENPAHQTYGALIQRGVRLAGPWHLFEMDGAWVFVHEQHRSIVPLSSTDQAVIE